MLKKALYAVCLGAALSLLSARGQAQITTTPSGCPVGPSVLVPVGNFGIGTQTVVTVVPIACSGTPIVLMFGNPLATPVTIQQPPACAPGPCLISCNPVVSVFGPNPFLPLSVTMPNDPTLVGFSFCMQAGCASTDPTGAVCFVFGDRTDVVVQ